MAGPVTNSPNDFLNNNRLSRSGTSRSSGPDRRDRSLTANPGALWELWTLRALWPEAGWEDLHQIKQRQEEVLAREREALAGMWAGDRSFLAPGHNLLQQNHGLSSGLVVSLHQGPYQLLAEPFLAAGLDPVILLNSEARDSFREPTKAFMKALGHRGKIQWVSVGDRGFARELIRAIRDERPVLVYLDGNSGEEGLQGTRNKGLVYNLPGRDIRVRTGLARLASRLQCPVHPVALHWDEEGTIVWQSFPSQQWSRGDDPNQITRLLYDWCFSEIMMRPHQWQYWAMLRESSACFSPGMGNSTQVPEGLREDFIRAFTICLEQSAATVKLLLEKSVEVWPGGILVDLTDDRFFLAEGIRDQDLKILRDGEPTLQELCAEHGLHWVKFHALRLCLLGMARLGG